MVMAASSGRQQLGRQVSASYDYQALLMSAGGAAPANASRGDVPYHQAAAAAATAVGYSAGAVSAGASFNPSAYHSHVLPPPALHPQGSAPLPSLPPSHAALNHTDRIFFSRSMPAGREAGNPQVQCLEPSLIARMEHGSYSSSAFPPDSAVQSPPDQATRTVETRSINAIHDDQAHKLQQYQQSRRLQENSVQHTQVRQQLQQGHPQQHQALSSIGRTTSDRTDYGQASCCPDVGWVANLVDDE